MALSAASGGSLNVPSNYHGGIYTGVHVPANTTLSCQSGGTFYDPKLNSSHTVLMTPGSGAKITGCTFIGTEPTFGAFYDVKREYNVMIAIWNGVNDVTISNNLFKNVWGTFVAGASGGSNATITDNRFQNCGYYGVQLNQIGGSNPGTYVSHNKFIDCNYASEDSAGVTDSPNQSQYIEHNDIHSSAQGGTGYNRSQKASGLNSMGSVFLSCGDAASGGTPNSEEYAMSMGRRAICCPHEALTTQNRMAKRCRTTPAITAATARQSRSSKLAGDHEFAVYIRRTSSFALKRASILHGPV
jgi:parallel beta helix pectate lyase-like protein